MLDAKIKKDRVPDVYRRIAPVYDVWAWLTERDARDRCLKLAAIRDGESVLEVAVGTGMTFLKILEANPSGQNEGIDLTPAMLQRAETRAARTRLSSYDLRVGDAYDLPFEDDSFDVLVNNYMFDLLPEEDFPAVLDEFKRVLRPRGRLAMVNMTQGKRWYNATWSILYRVNPALLGGCRSVSLLPFVQASGFRDTTREYVSQFTFPSEVVFGIAGSGPQ
jgi:ubiquinone/menaquinone biosynthesis C-methylase UbiE